MNLSCSVTLSKKGNPVWLEDRFFSGAATKKRGKIGATEQVRKGNSKPITFLAWRGGLQACLACYPKGEAGTGRESGLMELEKGRGTTAACFFFFASKPLFSRPARHASRPKKPRTVPRCLTSTARVRRDAMAWTNGKTCHRLVFPWEHLGPKSGLTQMPSDGTKKSIRFLAG